MPESLRHSVTRKHTATPLLYAWHSSNVSVRIPSPRTADLEQDLAKLLKGDTVELYRPVLDR